MTKRDRSEIRLWIGALALIAFLSLVSSSCSAAEDPVRTDGVRTVYLIRHGDYDHDDGRDPMSGRPWCRSVSRKPGSWARDSEGCRWRFPRSTAAP